jgi:hypothetical protein
MFVLCLTTLLIADVCPLSDYSFASRCLSFVWLLFWYQMSNISYQKSSQTKDKHLLSKELSDKGQASAIKRVVRQRTNICYQKSSQTKDKHLLSKEESDKGQTSAIKIVVRQRTNICYQNSTALLIADVCPLSDYYFDSRCLSFVWLLFW